MNLIAVLAVAVLNIIMGTLWYSPMLFGKKWVKLSGVTAMKGTQSSYALGLLSSIAMSYVLAMFVDYTGAATLLAGAFVGFMAWVGFVATVTLGSVIWEGRPTQLYLLNNAYNLISLLIMGAILAIWA